MSEPTKLARLTATPQRRAADIPTEVRPSMREVLAELARVMARCDLPDPKSMDLRIDYIAVYPANCAGVDAWASALGISPEPSLSEYEYRSPIWSYGAFGARVCGWRVSVSVQYEIPTGDDLVVQPAVSS